ncbi:MAG: PAS domain S-box protein [Nitrospirae bacterium]|nr:PAS domain S-box protein [Nitrospirota bacterium]MBI4847244.1 PAS domain S-box protein [Nitrospirota bacterium]
MKETGGSKVIRITSFLALILSIMVAVLLPSAYFVLSYQEQSSMIETEAEANAYFITQLINANPSYWRYSQHRLNEALNRFTAKGDKEARRIFDTKNEVLASNEVDVEAPVIKHIYPLFDAGNVVARIEISRSLRPVLKNTALFGLLGCVLGLSGYFIIKIFPLNALSQALKSLYESEEKFRAITSTAVDGIIVMDNQGRIVYWNQAAERLFGHTPQEALGKDLHLFLAPRRYHEEYRNGFAKFSTTGTGFVIGKTLELTALKKDGTEFPIEVSTSGIMVKDKWHAVGLIHNITERKKAENKLAQLYDEVKSEAEVSKSLFELVETLNTSLEEKELVRNVLDLAPRYLRFNRMSLYFYDDKAGSFAFAGAYGLSPSEKEMLAAKTIRPGDFPAIDMIIKGEGVIIDNAEECVLVSGEKIDTFSIKSVMLVPISFRGKISGMICGIYTSGQPVEQKDISLLKGLAGGLGIALQNSKLYEESNERLKELTNKIETINAMAQLDKEILSSIDKNAILQTATTLTSGLITCDRVAVLLKEGDKFRPITEWGVGNFKDRTCDAGSSHLGIIEKKRGSLLIPDISKDSVNCVYHREQIEIGIRSSIIVPLISKDEILGILDIGSLYSDKLTPGHISTAEKIASQITVALEHAKLYDDLQELLINTTTSLISIIDAKSPWTKGHSERVTRYAVEIAREMGLQEKDINHVRLCGILHDIGKVGTFDGLLDKPGKLTDEEYELIKKHPGQGADIIAPIKQLNHVIPGILHHHERYDGKGYPFGLRGEDIPVCASILSVADSFDSMNADRPYRKSPGREYAISELKRCSGTQYNPKIVEVFLNVLERLGEKDG